MSEEKEKAPKKGGKNMVVVIVLVLGLAGGVFAGKTLFGGGKNVKVHEEAKLGHTVKLREGSEYVINLDDDHYLKVGIALGLNEKVKEDAIKSKESAISDTVIMTLTGMDRAELISKEGKEALKKTLTKKLNELLYEETKNKEAVLEVYFDTFMTQ